MTISLLRALALAACLGIFALAASIEPIGGSVVLKTTAAASPDRDDVPEPASLALLGAGLLGLAAVRRRQR